MEKDYLILYYGDGLKYDGYHIVLLRAPNLVELLTDSYKCNNDNKSLDLFKRALKVCKTPEEYINMYNHFDKILRIKAVYIVDSCLYEE